MPYSPETWLRPSRRWLKLRITEVLLTAVALVVAAVLLSASASASWREAAVAGALVLSVFLLIVEVRRYFAWGYCERSRDLLVRRGVLVRRLTVVPYGRMQLVEATAGAGERLFGLATIKLHTAAAATDARIPGLESEEATRLRDQLAALGEAQAAGV
ncbi:MAG: PH domain-containing protein [Acidimicrobiales bacterium]